MRRRGFIGTLARAAALAALPKTPLWPGRPRSRNWAWVHGNDPVSHDEWRRRFGRARSAGIDAVLVSGGEAPPLAEAAHSEGLEFHRWIWVLNRSGDEWVKRTHPEWFTRSRNGDSSLEKPPYVDYYQWLCPTRQGVRSYLRGLVDALAAEPHIDGVHLDYIRHCDVILPRGLWSKYGLVQDRELPEFDFCYCEVCRSSFERSAGVDPLELPDPAQDVAWRVFRSDSVTGLVEELAGAVRSHGKLVSAAVFPTPALARRLVRQAWDEWPLDAFFPMLYNGFYEEDLTWIGASTRQGLAALSSETLLFAGIYLADLSPEELATAARIATASGAAGVSIFELGGLSDPHLSQLRAALAG